MIRIICKICKREFKDYSYRKNRKYCSIKCAYIGRKKYRKSRRMKRRISNWMKKHLKNPKNHPNWQGGRRVDVSGYILIYNSSHPFRHKDNCVFEHRLIMEKKLGRYLTKKERIHHKNGIRDDNRLSNLALVYNKIPHYGKIKCPFCNKNFLIR